MNPTIDLIRQHCSIRKFSETEISMALLEQLLLAGQSAATSSFIQATTVIHVVDFKKRARLVELSGQQNYVGSAAVFLVFCADLQRQNQCIQKQGIKNQGIKNETIQRQGTTVEFGWAEQFITATIDVSLFAQNVVIAAQSAGLGCCYIGGIRNQPDSVCELLALPALVYPVFGLCIGYPAQSPKPKPRLPLATILHQDNYESSNNTGGLIDAYDDEIRQYYRQRTNGKLDSSWSEQMQKQAANQTRPFMLDFLHSRGLVNK
jgi:nitroreductase